MPTLITPESIINLLTTIHQSAYRDLDTDECKLCEKDFDAYGHGYGCPIRLTENLLHALDLYGSDGDGEEFASQLNRTYLAMQNVTV